MVSTKMFQWSAVLVASVASEDVDAMLQVAKIEFQDGPALTEIGSVDVHSQEEVDSVEGHQNSALRCDWSEIQKLMYISGCSKKCARFKDLHQAKAACDAETTCGGVTLEHGAWELRLGPKLGHTPKGKGENSYVCKPKHQHEHHHHHQHHQLPGTVALVPGSIVALKGGKDGKYCADEGAKGVKCNRPHLKSWEKFTVVNAGEGKIALKGGKDGKYCADEGAKGVKCNRPHLKSWEKFTVAYAGGGKIALKGGKHGKYCADEGNKINCNRPHLKSWEEFTVTVVSAALKPPSTRGCWLLTPSGCPKQDYNPAKIWERDTWGEQQNNAAQDQHACLAIRKKAIDEWCGATDTQMKWNPSSPP